MKTHSFKTILYHLFRISLGVVFLAAALPKIQNPAAFAEIIGNYRILPEVLIQPVAVWLPWLEAICGVFLVLDRFSRGAAFLVTAMMAVFTAALIFNYFRGLDVDCGCFSVMTGTENGKYTMYILRDIALLIVSGWVLKRALSRKGRSPGLEKMRMKNV